MESHSKMTRITGEGEDPSRRRRHRQRPWTMPRQLLRHTAAPSPTTSQILVMETQTTRHRLQAVPSGGGHRNHRRRRCPIPRRCTIGPSPAQTTVDTNCNQLKTSLFFFFLLAFKKTILKIGKITKNRGCEYFVFVKIRYL